MIKYFLSVGGDGAGVIFPDYLWEENGFIKTLEPKLRKDGYGKELELFLIEYYVSGNQPTMGIEKLKGQELRVLRYNSKEKSIAVAMHVSFRNFVGLSEKQRRQFIVQTTLKAVDAARDRYKNRRWDVNFELLRQDIHAAGEIYESAVSSRSS